MTGNISEVAPIVQNVTSGQSILCWTEFEKSLVLSAFYYGYIFLQIPGGRLAEVHGTKKILGISTVFSTIFSFLLPATAEASVWGVFVIKFLQGVVQGVVFPCVWPVVVRKVS